MGRMWESKTPEGAQEVEGVAVHQATELGSFGFRHFTVMVEGEEHVWPGSLWDSERQIWWGFLSDDFERIAIWKADPPPDNVS